jgi:hypothetical protein
MSWKFDPISVDLVWAVTSTEIIESGSIDFGSLGSDLLVDTGDRSNDSSTLDQGLRVIDGSI